MMVVILMVVYFKPNFSFSSQTDLMKVTRFRASSSSFTGIYYI